LRACPWVLDGGLVGRGLSVTSLCRKEALSLISENSSFTEKLVIE
jgi:hypothetical protein